MHAIREMVRGLDRNDVGTTSIYTPRFVRINYTLNF